MKHYRTKIIPAKETRVVDKTTCDICKESIEAGGFFRDDVEISREWGDAFPECGNGHKIEFDICGECFNSQLVPWMETKGAETIETEWDY